MLYCKGRRGVMPLPNLVLMLPFMLLHLVLSRIKQATRDRGESQSDRVAPSVWLGRYPFSRRLCRNRGKQQRKQTCGGTARPPFPQTLPIHLFIVSLPLQSDCPIHIMQQTKGIFIPFGRIRCFLRNFPAIRTHTAFFAQTKNRRSGFH